MLKRISTVMLVCLLCTCILVSAWAAEPDTTVAERLQVSELFTIMPRSYVSTPDGMAFHPTDGSLVVACPNFGDQSMPGTIVKVNQSGVVTPWFDVPVNVNSGVARPMGIDFDTEGNLYIVDNQGWTGNLESVDQGRILKVEFDEYGKPAKTTEIAVGMEHPNGIKIRGDYAYVTVSSLARVQDPSGLLVSGVYCFPIDAQGIEVTNTLADKNILTTFITLNPNVQYGADGLVFDAAGNLYVGNFGDGAIHKIIFNTDGSVRSNEVWAKDNTQMATTDGMCIDKFGNIYVADFSRNAVAKVSPNGTITRIAQSPDSTGLGGELDQPGEPIVWGNKLILTCFDMVTDDGKINSQHEMPATMAYIELDFVELGGN